MVFWLVAVVVLFPGFRDNAYGVAEASWFEKHQRSIEGFVIGRMIVAERDGLLSHGALPGLCSETDDRPAASYRQRAIYLRKLPTSVFEPYMSQPGAQGWLWALLADVSPLTRAGTLSALQGVVALLSALAFGGVMAWIGTRFGGAAFALALATAVFSPWLTVSCRNLWWVMGAFTLPLFAVVFVIAKPDRRVGPSIGIVALAVSAKCLLNGYEYMTTTLAMMVVPLVHAWVADAWPLRRLTRIFTAIAAGAAIGMGLVMVLLLLQIASVEGSLSDGVNHVVESVEKRTYGEPSEFPPEYRKSLEAGVQDAVAPYFAGAALSWNQAFEGKSPDQLPNDGRVTYGDLVILFALAAMAGSFLAWRFRDHPLGGRRMAAAVAATAFSIVAPLSWFVVFKAHSFVHTHMNFVVWHMPFVVLGFGLCGAVIELAARLIVDGAAHVERGP